MGSASPEIVIKSSKDVTTTWSRDIQLGYYGHAYGVILEWDEWDGFNTYWSDQDKRQCDCPQGIESPDLAPSNEDLYQLVIDWEVEAGNNLTE